MKPVLTLLLLLSLTACNNESKLVQVKGAKGDPGSIGPVGPTGPQGAPGLPGGSCTTTATANGALISCTDGSSTVVSNGADGSNGTDGNDGADGHNGTNGINGIDGHNGTDGTPGINATPITVVNFCPGVTTYPSTFVEVGFCISNQLYAVYSENNGFMVLVPPGNYSSNAHGSSCTFTVLPNCIVGH